MKGMKQILFLFSMSLIFLLSSHHAIADDERVSFAKSLTAREYDNTLPSIPIERWLRSILKESIAIEWGAYITDCGEQTGDPKIDKERDIPLCAEVELKEDNNLVGYLLLFIGTENEGVVKEKACLYYGYINSNGKQIAIKKLSDLANIR